MYEAEIMLTAYTIIVVACTLGISQLLCLKRTKQIQKENNDLRNSLLLIENENSKLKSQIILETSILGKPVKSSINDG